MLYDGVEGYGVVIWIYGVWSLEITFEGVNRLWDFRDTHVLACNCIEGANESG